MWLDELSICRHSYWSHSDRDMKCYQFCRWFLHTPSRTLTHSGNHYYDLYCFKLVCLLECFTHWICSGYTSESSYFCSAQFWDSSIHVAESSFFLENYWNMLLRSKLSSLSSLITSVWTLHLLDCLSPFHLALFLKFWSVLSFGPCFFVSSFCQPLFVFMY